MAPPSRRVRFRWPTAFVALAAAAGGVYYLTRPEPPLEVEVVRVERGRVREMVPSASAGRVEAARRATVRAEIPGTVRSVGKKKGDRVRADEILVVFGAEELDARLSQAKANLEAARVTVEIAEARAETAAKAATRAKKLFEGGAVAPLELERAESEARAAEQATEQARAARRQAEAALKLAQVARDRAVVRAPFAGVLQEVFAEVGVQAAPGAALFDLIDDSAVRVVIPVDESDAAKIFVGQEVYLRIGGRRERTVEGKVVFIPPAVGRGTGAGSVDVAALSARDRALFVEAEPSDASGLRIGASVDGEFLVSARDDVLWIPTHVVTGRGLLRSVFKVSGDKLVEASFRPGLTSWERTEVVSGLEGGDAVVSSLNVKGLEDGARVRIKGGASGSTEEPASATAGR